MKSRTSELLIAIVVVAAALAFIPSPTASAATTARTRQPTTAMTTSPGKMNTIQPYGVGVGSYISGVQTERVYQCPAMPQCDKNWGTDYAGNDIAAICYAYPAGEGEYILTLDHADNVAGWMSYDGHLVVNGLLGPCPKAPGQAGAGTAYQCPEYFCNHGLMGEPRTLECTLGVDDSGFWDLYLGLSDWVVGFTNDTSVISQC